MGDNDPLAAGGELHREVVGDFSGVAAAPVEVVVVVFVLMKLEFRFKEPPSPRPSPSPLFLAPHGLQLRCKSHLATCGSPRGSSPCPLCPSFPHRCPQGHQKGETRRHNHRPPPAARRQHKTNSAATVAAVAQPVKKKKKPVNRDGDMEDADPPSSTPTAMEQNVTCAVLRLQLKALEKRANALEQGNEELKAILRETVGVFRNQRARVKPLELDNVDLRDSLRRFSKLFEEHRIEMSRSCLAASSDARKRRW
ncbi:hypothetical protein EDC01DRAFT_776446 [Geopyxis carbonaria]|nr:hypothetical protein EDC01DRAFT_776446 [Geopyxis carbonaria]